MSFIVSETRETEKVTIVKESSAISPSRSFVIRFIGKDGKDYSRNSIVIADTEENAGEFDRIVSEVESGAYPLYSHEETGESLKNGFVFVTDRNYRPIRGYIDLCFLGETGAAFRLIDNPKTPNTELFASFISKEVAAKRPDEFDDLIGFTVFDFSLVEEGEDIVFNDPSVSTIEEANEAFNRYIESVK